MASSAAQPADSGPQLTLQTRGLGFRWRGSGPQNPDTPERAVSVLGLLDVANYGAKLDAPADRVPGAALVIGPLAADADRNQYVLCWHRHGPCVTKEQPGLASLIVIPVVRKREGLDGEAWRDRMIAEAQRDGGRIGKVHFFQTRAVQDFRALPHVLAETFGRDGEGWAQTCDWWLDHSAVGATFAPFEDS